MKVRNGLVEGFETYDDPPMVMTAMEFSTLDWRLVLQIK